MLFLRSLAFSTGLWLSTAVFAPLSVLTFPLPPLSRYRFISQWTRFNLWWLKHTCNLRYHLIGREHLPRDTAIALCKHQSTWETLALQEILPPQVWVLKRELLWLPLFGWGLAMMDPIAINRRAGKRAITQIIEQGRQRLDTGRWVVVFPEGTRVAPGEHRRFGIGGAVLAAETGHPVVPIAHNAGYFWPRRGFIKRPGVITAVIGPVIDSRGRSAEEINRIAEDWIRETTASLAPTDAASRAV